MNFMNNMDLVNFADLSGSWSFMNHLNFMNKFQELQVDSFKKVSFVQECSGIVHEHF